MQEQDALKLLAFQLELPGQDARGDNWQGADSCAEKVVIGDGAQARALRILRKKVKNYSGDEQRNRKMNERDVLRVLCEQNRFWIEGIHVGFL